MEYKLKQNSSFTIKDHNDNNLLNLPEDGSNNLVDTTSEQTITGKKKLRGRVLEFESTNAPNKLEIYNDNGYNAKIKMGNTENIRLMSGSTSFGTDILPITTDNRDIGLSSYRWKDIYLSGGINPNASGYKLTIPDTTSWTADKEIATTDQAFNVVYVSEMTDNLHFSQEQIEKISNGKPTRVIGSLNNQLNNAVFLSCFEEAAYLWVTVSYANSSSDRGFTYIAITKADGFINIRNNKIRFSINELYLSTDNGGLNTIYVNGKKLPDYPSSPTMPQALIYDTDNTLKYVNTPNANISDMYDNTKTYAVGDIVIYNNVLYKCTTAVTTAEDFDSTKWTATTIDNEFAKESQGFNTINAIDIVNNIITSSQKAILTNGKPTRIIGSLRDLTNPIIYNMYVSGTTYFGRIIGISSTGTMVDSICYIYNDEFSLDSGRIEYQLSGNKIDIFKLNKANGKTIPAYPTDLTKDYSFEQEKTTGNLKWVEKETIFNVDVVPSSTSQQVTSFTSEDIINALISNKTLYFTISWGTGWYSKAKAVAYVCNNVNLDLSQATRVDVEIIANDTSGIKTLRLVCVPNTIPEIRIS